MKNKIQYSILWYLMISFTMAIVLDLAYGKLGNEDFPLDLIILSLPGLTVIGLYLFRLRRSIFKSRELGFSLKGWQYWILAPLVITVISFLAYGISIFLNPGLLKSRESIIWSLEESGFFFGHIGLGLTTVSLINALLGSLASIPVFLGQELGWRAFLFPRLLKILKPLPTFIVLGILWGSWTFIFLDPLFNGLVRPLTGILLTIVLSIPLGIIFQYFYFKTRSIFVAALAHGALYQSFDTASLFLSHSEMNTLALTPVGVYGMALFWILALILFTKINWHTNNIYHE